MTEANRVDEASMKATISYEQLMSQAATLAEASDYFAATDTYREAAALAPQRPDAHYEMGLLHQKLGRVAEAIACCKRAADLGPEDGTVWNNLGVLYYSRRQPAHAERAFRQALGLDERYDDTWYRLAKPLLAQGHDAQAAEALERVAELAERGDQGQEKVPKSIVEAIGAGEYQLARTRHSSISRRAKTP